MSKSLTSTRTAVTGSRTELAQIDIRLVVEQLDIGLQRLPEQVLQRLARARALALMAQRRSS